MRRDEVQDPVADLRRRLARIALRGGDPIALTSLRRCVRAWWTAHGLGAHPAIVGKRVALALLGERGVDARRAGMLVLAEQLGEQLRAADLADAARLFAGEALAAPGLVELFARTVVTALLVHAPDRRAVVRALAGWREAASADQRRAACLGLAGLLARVPGEHAALVEPALGVCATVVWSIDPQEQAAVGLLLRALAFAEPARVEAFVRRHAHLMSRTAVQRATARLSSTQRAALRAHHRRATTPRSRRPPTGS